MNKYDFVREKSEEVIITLHVKPNSKIQSIKLDIDGSMVVYLKSPPDKGKANKELVKLLAKFFDCSSSVVLLVSGQTSRDKTLVLKEITLEEVHSYLSTIE
ncbi:MAG: DUF167 domain-containing protein, partial [Candidatus Heimdallarchaeota archaeon]